MSRPLSRASTLPPPSPTPLDSLQTSHDSSSSNSDEERPSTSRETTQERSLRGFSEPPVGSERAQSPQPRDERLPVILEEPSPRVRRQEPQLMDNVEREALRIQLGNEIAVLMPLRNWEMRKDVFEREMKGHLYGRINRRYQSISSIDSDDPMWSYIVTAGSFGCYKFLNAVNCMICLKQMKVLFFYNNNNCPFLKDDKGARQRRRELVHPYWRNGIWGLVHNACSGSIEHDEYNFYFRLMDRKLSLQEWWRIMTPLPELAKGMLISMIALCTFFSLLYFVVFGFIEPTVNHVICWTFISAIGAVAIIKLYGGRSGKFLNIQRSFVECWQACCGNYKQIKLDIWEH